MAVLRRSQWYVSGVNLDLTSIARALDRLIAAQQKGGWDYIGTVAVVLTLFVLVLYTYETFKLRKAAQAQTEQGNKLFAEAQRQNQTSLDLLKEAQRQNDTTANLVREAHRQNEVASF